MKTKLFNAFLAVMLLLMSNVTFAQAPILGTAANFVLFTTNGAMTGSGTMYLTHLTGKVGSNLPGSVTGFGNVDGAMHTADVVTGVAAADVVSLYTQLGLATPTGTLTSPIGGGTILGPGVYSIPTAATLNGDLILDAVGDPNAVFIFKINGMFATSASAKVKLINGALACNVFWQVGGAVDMGTQTSFKGTIVADGQIDMTSTLDTLEGRALAINAQVLVSQLVAYTPLGCGSPYLTGPAAPALASTAAYGVFSSIGAVTSTPITYVIGKVGGNSEAPTGFNPLNVTDTIHAMDPSTAAAAGDLTNVYNYLVALPHDINLLDPANLGHGLVLTPHTYQLTGITQLTGNLILNAQGNPNAVFVIKINGAFTTGTLSRIMLINGAQAKNVYWKIDGAVNIFSNSVFNGTLVVAGAITLNTGDTLNGRALTIGGAVAINGSYVNITPAACVASPITGTTDVCEGATTTLSNVDTGGVWQSSNPAVATIGSTSGIVTGITPGNAIITFVSGLACQITDTVTVNASPLPVAGIDSVVCEGSSIVFTDLSPGGVWSSSSALTATVGSVSGIVTGVASGIATISYTLPTSCFAVKAVTVNPMPNAGTITGTATVCPGNTTTLSNATSGGTWSSVNPAIATVGSSTGIVTGVTNGTTTISYTVTNGCGTAAATTVVTVSATPNAGINTGIATLCTGNTTTLSNATSGGIWSSVNPAIATVGSLTGIVTGVATGTTTISYTVTNGCGTAAATTVVTVNPMPDAGTLTGPSDVCVGSTITLTESVPGGIWSSSNTNAVVTGGNVTGVSAGTVVISYSVTNVCGTASATKSVTVNLMPNAGVITGSSVVCVGSSITLSNVASGGVWSASNPTATVTGGVVTGVAAGIDTISYTVTNTCGTAIATKAVTINPMPNAGTLTGPSAVCVGSTITLTESVSGGTWSSSNANAVVIGGNVTGVSAGTVVISYSVTNVCGTATATKSVTVNPMPDAGVITGSSVVCVGSSITLSNVASGGTWSASNPTATVTGGVVTGVTAGIDTISYTVTNTCGTAIATKAVTINPMPNAGTLTGPSAVCVGSTITLTESVPGGIWSSSNANAVVIGGNVTGVSAGTVVISYSVTNVCGTATATKSLTVNPMPNAGVITGSSVVCVGSSITLSNVASGGIWSSSNATATVSITGVVTGVTAGIDTISYTVTNTCGTAIATKAVTINPLPNAGVVTGASSVCLGSSITLSNLATGGIWSNTNGRASVSGGVVTGILVGMDTIIYTVTNSCGTATATKTIVINPLPDAGNINGLSSVCIGSTIILTNSVTGGVWTVSSAVATITGSGVVTGVSAGTVTVTYAVTNMCGTDLAIKVITVNLLPSIPVISTQSPSTACTGTMYQNFGAATMPPANTSYKWTAINATVWAQGTGHQYALVNFTTTGTALVTLSANTVGTGCASSNTVAIIVGSTVAHSPRVSYFNNHFVCTPNDLGSYQWGYDNIYSLDSTILVGEINQDYVSTAPDFANKAYWAMTTVGGCLQKTYYRVPTAVQNVSNGEVSISVYPNPASTIVNVAISASINDNITVEVSNMMGQKISTVQTSDNKAAIDVAGLPSGYYMIACYHDGIKIATSRFVKN